MDRIREALALIAAGTIDEAIRLLEAILTECGTVSQADHDAARLGSVAPVGLVALSRRRCSRSSPAVTSRPNISRTPAALMP